MYTVAISHVEDGSMKSFDQSYKSVLETRSTFLENHQILPEDTTLVHLVYEGSDYLRFVTATEDLKGDGIVRPPTIIADGIVTTTPGHSLFLPLADCIGAVIYDPSKEILMLSHLGRHNLEQSGGTKSIEYLVEQFSCNPADLTVWLSPAAGQKNYPIFAFENRSLHDVATEQLVSAGILPSNISKSDIDVTKDATYFSHSEFLKSNRESDGRFAIVATLSDQVAL